MIDLKTLSKDKLTKIGTLVKDEFERDIQSRSEWMKRGAEWYKLFTGFRDEKTFPWEDCSNVHIPLLGTAVMQYHARAYDALFASREIAKCFSTDGKKESMDAAKRGSKYLNYQLTEEMEEWEEEADNAFIIQSIYGVAVKKTYYDALLGRITSRLLDISSFVAPYRCRRLEDATRKTHYFNISLNEVKKRVKLGIYNEEAKDLKSTKTDSHTIDSNIPNSVDKATGEKPPAETEEQILILEQHRLLDIDEDGILEPYIVTIEYDTALVLSIAERWDKDPLTGKQIVFEYFTSYPFIPNPESWCGFGFGVFMEGLNESANTILNQLIDSGTLANVLGLSGFINKRSGLKKGQIRAKLGEFVEVDANSSDFAKDIFQFKAEAPSTVLFAVLGLLQQYSKEISSVSDSLLGKLPPSDTTATTMLAVMEQGMKVFSVIHKRNHRSFKKELKKISLLNSFHLPDEIYFMVQDSSADETQYEFSGKMDFANRIDVIPVSDPSITSRAEKLVKAKTAYEIGTTNPLLAQDQEFQYKITKKLFEANEINDIEIPKPKPQELPDMTPEEEHASILMDKGVHALPEQDHLRHMDSHDSFKSSVWFEQLTPHGKKLLEEHEREHLSMQYLVENKPQESMNGTDTGGVPGMEMPPMYETSNA